MVKRLNDFLISDTKTIKAAMEQLNGISGKGIYVVCAEGSVCGSITDGDIRRALLRGVSINDNVSKAMQEKFISVEPELSELQKKETLALHGIQSVPILNSKKQLIDIYTVDSDEDYAEINVILLAGGMGTRLGKITENIPKPMVEVAGKPMLERIIRKIVEQKFSRFYISTNYKSEIIEDYFQDGKKFNCHISYLKENMRLGTAGPLSLLPKTINTPIVVMNGDLLTQVDLGRMLQFHIEHKSKVTMGIRTHEMQVPFGVVNIENGMVSSFVEKPSYSFNVNAGIYIVDPTIVNSIPENQYYDMSTLLNSLLDKGDIISCFPIVEEWIDVGRESDLHSAREIYKADK